MSGSPTFSPPTKRVKLQEDEGSLSLPDVGQETTEESDNNCSICLQAMEDRTVVPTCSHDFCFDCLMIWTAQSRRCPLCTQTIGEYVIHDIRSRFDYRKQHLAPLRSTSPQLLLPPQTTAAIEARNSARRRRRERERERQRREELDERDKLELSIAMRRWIYKHDLYAKACLFLCFIFVTLSPQFPRSNPSHFAASPDLISRTTSFLRRELQVWHGLDIEFLTSLIISLMKAIDIRSESAVKLLAEFLDMDTQYEPGNRYINAEHFAHVFMVLPEVYSYVRSPYRDLFVYDSVVQYERPPNVSPPPQARRQRTRWETREHGQRRSRERMPSRSPPRSPQLTQDNGHAVGLGEVEGLERLNSSNSGSPSIDRVVPVLAASPEQRQDNQGHRTAGRTPRQDTSGRSRKGKEKERVLPESLAQVISHFQDGNGPNNALQATSPISCLSTGEQSPNADGPGVEDTASRQAREREMTPNSDALASQHVPLHFTGLSENSEQPSIAKGRAPRLKSLSESIRTHLSLVTPSRLPRNQHHDGLQRRMSPSENSHCPLQRLPLPQRLSDPVTTLIDQTDEGTPSQQHATDPHHGIADNHGGIPLGPEITPDLVSSNSHLRDEISTKAEDLQIPTSTPQSVIPSSSSSTHRTSSSLHDHHCQDDSAKIAGLISSLTASSVPPTGGVCWTSNSSNDIISNDSSVVPTPEPSSSAQTRATLRTHINSVQKEVHQPHVGPAPPAMATHGPHAPSPIIIHHDRNPTSLSPDFRAKLLFRLREENKQAGEDSNNVSTGVKEVQGQQCDPSAIVDVSIPTSELDRNSPNYNVRAYRSLRRSIRDCRDRTDAEGLDSAPQNTSVDTAMLEARLRTRVRLRTKLEEEKRFNETQ
ncbi:hypothetical protein D9756_010626 [Leucocoprinus leucothites]|uniref:RING-type E3 ubiquitin transferase n=1 Tax=Leucocoprinus leucothites TaxID=201217 RepID=A0A8H5CSL0_9AGAR|nr:hypothetical protein D9756_010626 [Leucoagaricus leucothites]